MRAKKGSLIDQHPQKEAIIDSILRGETLTAMSQRYGVSRMAIQRYKVGPIRKILNTRNIANIKTVNSDSAKYIKSVQQDTQAVAAMSSTASYVERKLLRYDRVLAKAEETGNLGAWASIDKAETSALDLRAKLSGELLQSPTVVNNMFVAVAEPGELAASRGEVIEATVIPPSE